MDLMKKKLYRNLLIIVGVFVIIFIILFAYQGCTGRNISHEKIEEKMISGAEKYFEKMELLPKDEAGISIVSAATLIENDYIDPFSKMTNDTDCDGNVTVQKNGEYYNYMVYLKCGESYETKTLNSEITSNIVTSGDGLYKVGNEYVFKGEKVNNYVNFAGRIWRIIKITEDGYLKLVDSKKEEETISWDDRYNIDEDANTGINNYEKSRIKSTIDKLYDNKDKFSAESKKIITAHDVCIGKRNENNFAFDTKQECSEVIENQFLSLIDVIDASRASVDENCKNINSPSCINYNYFSQFFGSSWTTISVTNSSSKVYKTSASSMYANRCDKEGNIYINVYINSNTKYRSGSGEENDPFTL